MASSRMWLVVPGVFIPIWITLGLWGGVDWRSIVVGALLLLAVALVGWNT